MQRNQHKDAPGGIIILLLVLLSAVALERGLVSDSRWYLVLIFTIPGLLVFIIIWLIKNNDK